VTLVAVSIGEPQKAAKFLDQTGYLGYQYFFVDTPPDLRAYRALGLAEFFTAPKDPWRYPIALLNPFKALATLKKWARGVLDATVAKKWNPQDFTPRQIKSVTQQGATFAIGASGELVFAYKDRVPNEYANLDEVFDALGIGEREVVIT